MHSNKSSKIILIRLIKHFQARRKEQGNGENELKSEK